MSKTTTRGRSHRRPRRTVLLAGAALAAVLAGSGALAVTGSPAVVRQSDGGVAIDGQALAASYHGRVLTPGELETLSGQRPDITSVTNRETSCHGVSLLFDDDAQADRCIANFTQRKQQADDRHRTDPQGSAPSDPCADWQAPLPTSTPARTR